MIPVFIYYLSSPAHNRSMVEEYATTETESVISSRHSGMYSFFIFIFKKCVIFLFMLPLHSILFCSLLMCFFLFISFIFVFCCVFFPYVSIMSKDRHILHRSARVHREAYDKYDRFDGEFSHALYFFSPLHFLLPSMSAVAGRFGHEWPEQRNYLIVFALVHGPRNGHGGMRLGRPGHEYESSSMISSDLESTSFVDSEEDASSRITTTTGNIPASIYE